MWSVYGLESEIERVKWLVPKPVVSTIPPVQVDVKETEKQEIVKSQIAPAPSDETIKECNTPAKLTFASFMNNMEK